MPIIRKLPFRQPMLSRTNIFLHRESLFAELSLALFVLWILANYSDTAFSFDDFALFANRLYR